MSLEINICSLTTNVKFFILRINVSFYNNFIIYFVLCWYWTRNLLTNNWHTALLWTKRVASSSNICIIVFKYIFFLVLRTSSMERTLWADVTNYLVMRQIKLLALYFFKQYLIIFQYSVRQINILYFENHV